MSRLSSIGLISAALGMGLLVLAGSNPAAACNRTAGCVMDVLWETYEMQQDGRWQQCLRAGQDNIEAFRRLRAAEEAARRRPQETRR